MKIFGIGFHKTGSTTLETALITLGYDTVGKKDHLFEDLQNNRWAPVDEVVQQHDAFRDMPWPLFYDKLDDHYPGSKYILTVRDSRQWLASCVNHYKDKGHAEFAHIYGTGNQFPLGNEDVWMERYLSHNRAVREYFRDRPEDFLEVDWEKGSGWNELCTFLDQPRPDRPFPHANQGKYTLWEKMIRRVHYLYDKEGFQKKNRDL